jgi:signal transduction histidine kinase
MLRWNPLAQDIADGIVASGAATVRELAQFLEQRGVQRVRAIEHEDDLPEIALLVDWAWQRLSLESRRILGVLAHIEGDHVDLDSLATLSRIRTGFREALVPLERWHLVQEPVAARYTVHAVVRHAVLKRTTLDQARVYEHYVGLLEQSPERLLREQTHLFAAMDHAHRTSDLNAMLRVEALARRLSGLD